MINDPKEKSSVVQSILQSDKTVIYNQKREGWFKQAINSDSLLQLSSASVQILLGLSVVAISILGLIQPLWLSTLMSMVGSVSVMAGTYSVYDAVAGKNTFDLLINHAIRRVIRSQN
jgi:hypothetical protein